MKHDETKIEEIINQEIQFLHGFPVYIPKETREKIKIEIKKYTEHMIQQERKEKERLEHDYACVLGHATKGKMSKTNYFLNTIYSVIDEAQQESIERVISDDIKMIIEDLSPEDAIQEIKSYLSIN